MNAFFKNIIGIPPQPGDQVTGRLCKNFVCHGIVQKIHGQDCFLDGELDFKNPDGSHEVTPMNDIRVIFSTVKHTQ